MLLFLNCFFKRWGTTKKVALKIFLSILAFTFLLEILPGLTLIKKRLYKTHGQNKGCN